MSGRSIGERATWQYYSLDGVTNTDIDFNLYIVLPSVDALQEFKVQSGIYPAEFGREAGKSTSPPSREPTIFTEPPSSFFATTLWTRSPMISSPPVPIKQPYRQNQYGFTVDGPVWIPKLFNGKNKLFFMSNFEGFKSRLTTAALATTLPAAMRAGDFSGLTNITLLDPNTRVQNANGTYSATPFPNNIIPPSRINQQSLAPLAYDPLPNEPSQSSTLPFDNYLYNANTPMNKNQVTERVDFNESANLQWFGRYSWTGENGVTPGITSNDGSTLQTHANQWVVSNTRIFSPTKVNEARFGYSKYFQPARPAVGRSHPCRRGDRNPGSAADWKPVGHPEYRPHQ